MTEQLHFTSLLRLYRTKSLWETDTKMIGEDGARGWQITLSWLRKEFFCIVTQSCPILCDPMDCSLPGSSVYGDSPGKNTGVDCHALLQGVFPTQGSNPGLLHCRPIL